MAIAALVERISICDFYAEIYFGVPLRPRSTKNYLQLQSRLRYALPELLAAVIVFAVKARVYYFEAGSTYLEYINVIELMLN